MITVDGVDDADDTDTSLSWFVVMSGVDVVDIEFWISDLTKFSD